MLLASFGMLPDAQDARAAQWEERLLTWSRHRDHEFPILLGDKTLALTG
jgi:hypothetical protein